jgi:hypothetical protein
MTRRDWLLSSKTYTTSILALLRDEWGEEFLQWDPATVEMELASMGIQDPPEMLTDKIQAGSSLFTSNLFFVSFENFCATALVLGGNPFHSSTMSFPDLDDVMWAVTEARLLLGETYSEESFSQDIALFVGKLLADEGIYSPPQPLQFAEYPEDEVKNFSDFVSSVSGNAAEIDTMVQFDQMKEAANALEGVAAKKLDELLAQLGQLPLKSRNDAFFAQLAAPA